MWRRSSPQPISKAWAVCLVVGKSRTGSARPCKNPSTLCLPKAKCAMLVIRLPWLWPTRLEEARDAAEAVDIDITELEPVLNMKDALKDGATKVHDDLSSNLCYDWGFVEENRDAVDAAIKGAHHVTTLELKKQPSGCQPDGATCRGR